MTAGKKKCFRAFRFLRRVYITFQALRKVYIGLTGEDCKAISLGKWCNADVLAKEKDKMGFLVFALILYIIWDVNYFIRCVFTVFAGRLFQSKRKVTDTTSIYGLCTSQDVDIFIRHMNNARYLRELDFARFHFYALTGLYEQVKKRNGGAVQGASSVRYRRTIPIFHPYKIQTKLIWWDDKAIYLEQQFVTLSDGFVRAVAMSKQCITNCDVMDILKAYPEASKRPEIPEELKLWLDAIELSSQKLRKDK